MSNKLLDNLPVANGSRGGFTRLLTCQPLPKPTLDGMVPQNFPGGCSLHNILNDSSSLGFREASRTRQLLRTLAIKCKRQGFCSFNLFGRAENESSVNVTPSGVPVF